MTQKTRARKGKVARVTQGDIIRDVEYIESVQERGGKLEITKIVFPLVVVLTQDCDLQWDYQLRWAKVRPSNQDKALLSVLVVPLYNLEHVYAGEQLSNLQLQMRTINRNKTEGKDLRSNSNPRYHYLDFDETIPIATSVADFKQYFSVSVAYLKELKRSHFVCQLGALYREDLSQRFAAFLSRIGLPDKS